MNAHEYLAELQYPVFFYAGNGSPAGQSIAILDDDFADNLPISLSDLEGTVCDDGIFEATNLAEGNGLYDWKFTDGRGNIIYKVQLFSNREIFKQQLRDYESYT